MKPMRPILSIAFALLVLFSSSKVVVGIHFCKGSVQNVALFSEAESCAMEKQLPPCHRQQASKCCDDEMVVHDAQNFERSISSISPAGPHVVDIVQPIELLAEIIPSTLRSHIHYYQYAPPLRTSDRTVTLQVFLI